MEETALLLETDKDGRREKRYWQRWRENAMEWMMMMLVRREEVVLLLVVVMMMMVGKVLCAARSRGSIV
jgi:membrane protein YqaA with SNARE-associated domain